MNIQDRIDLAQDAFEAGFLSMAAKKRALDNLNRAYSMAQDNLSKSILEARTDENDEENSADYWGIPYDLHNVRDKHFALAEKYTPEFSIVKDLVALRLAIKAADIAPAPEKPAIEKKAEAVRRTIAEEMEFRNTQYIEALEIGRLFKGLPVSVNAHTVFGHKGAVFTRRFFYLAGKLTPLNIIICAAEALEAENA